MTERCGARECDNEGPWDEGEYCPSCQAQVDEGMADARASYVSREVRELDEEGMKDDPRTPEYWEARYERAELMRDVERGE